MVCLISMIICAVLGLLALAFTAYCLISAKGLEALEKERHSSLGMD